MPYRHRWIRVGPLGVRLPELWWEEPPPYWVDVERTADEIILTLRVPRDLRKEDVKVEYSEGRLRIRYPRRRGAWEEIPVE
ncbi:MAG: hypothetical protein AOA65_1308 [Candidatus Bathyarchaeota archaeon BA1]|nr:MAG: hypothetical protein AOA65_1308 [Candidatus Bathyarchaeota archaeon BA1]